MTKEVRVVAVAIVAFSFGSAAVMCSPFESNGNETNDGLDGSADDGPDRPSDDAAVTADGAQYIGPDGSSFRDAAVGPSACIHVAPGYCIDATEVTNIEYLTFLRSGGGAKFPGCSSTLTTGSARVADAVPVTGIDWCDAYSYCAWAGKHLCGQLDGGMVDAPHRGDPTQNEWTNACLLGGGNSVDCNIAGSSAKASSPSSGCGVPDAGVYDLVGNVWEWINSCDDAGCAFVGDGFAQTTGSCKSVSGQVPEFTADDVGFRCCGP